MKKNEANYVYYRAINSATGLGVTGDQANHTLRLATDGGASAAPTNSPAQVDATYLPGVYRVQLTAAECNFGNGALGGTSSTANVLIQPVLLTFEDGGTRIVEGAITEDMVNRALLALARGDITAGASAGQFIIKNADGTKSRISFTVNTATQTRTVTNTDLS